MALPLAVIAPVALGGCQAKRPPPEKQAAGAKQAHGAMALPWLLGATHVVATSGRVFVGSPDGVREFSNSGTQIRRYNLNQPALEVQTLELGDADGDGDPELVVGLGARRQKRGGPRVVVFELDGTDPKVEIEIPNTPRGFIVAAKPLDGAIWIAAFKDKYNVNVGVASAQTKWAYEVRETERMVWDLAPLKGGGVAVARLYGDGIETPGEAYVERSGARLSMDVVRGARSVAAADDIIAVADGWHREYRARAQARISLARSTAQGFTVKLLGEADGRAGFSELDLGDIDGDGRIDVVATGDGPAVIALGNGTAFTEACGGSSTDAAIADLDGDGSLEIVVVGSAPCLWRP